MRIALVTPESEWLTPETVTGNSVTADRWREAFVSLGHQVVRLGSYSDEDADLLVALHALKSADSIHRFRSRHREAPIVVALTGTDLYVDLSHELTQQSLDHATHIVALQPGALDLLAPAHRQKTTVIYQSARPGEGSEARADQRLVFEFDVVLVAHLREIKDPFLGARAVAELPETSRVRLRHVGAASSKSFLEEARDLERRIPRYEWLGPKNHHETRALIAAGRLLLLTSREEGGANVLSEALALGVPILATRARGVEGLLGPTYPGLVPIGDRSGLARSIGRAESDSTFYAELERACRELAPLVSPRLELESWRQLLEHVARLRGRPN
jgi:putative glycosyltransferase (TIGR04348 family)